MSDDEGNVLLPAPYIDERLLQGIEQTIALGRQRHIPAAIILEMIQFWLAREPARQEGGEQGGMAELYGPAATTASSSRGQVVVYDDHGGIENGKIVYTAAQNEQGQPDLHYIVSPESSVSRRPFGHTRSLLPYGERTTTLPETNLCWFPSISVRNISGCVECKHGLSTKDIILFGETGGAT